MDIGAEKDIYIPRIQWTNNPNKLSIQRLNRLQNKLDLLIADVNSGQSKLALSGTDPCWIDYLDNIEFLNNKKQFIWMSERDGFQHIYLYNMDGSLERQLTKGKWEVGNVYGVNEKRRLVYFSANKVNITESHIYSIKLNGKSLKRLTKKKGWHRANFSPDWESFILMFSNSHTPAQYSLLSDTGANIRTLEENKIEALDEYDISYPQFLTFDTEDGVTLNAMMIKPTDFDKNKKYPVLIYGYGGPGSQMVRNSWGRSNFLWHNLLAQKGYIIFSLDNRGTGGRGKAFKNLAYRDIGKWMIYDHIEGAKYLAKLPYVDKERIGIWGWSGGGYLTLMALTKGSDYFKTGIAVASVSDFRFYDSIWTERYMGLPQDNAAGYDSTSALNYVDKYKGNLLIIHGAADDNVHTQNSMQFIEKMQSANKQFNLMLYPGKNHSLLGRNTRLHLYTLMTDFILKNL
jgi:dipeptidyl-peptidase-4